MGQGAGPLGLPLLPPCRNPGRVLHKLTCSRLSFCRELLGAWACDPPFVKCIAFGEPSNLPRCPPMRLPCRTGEAGRWPHPKGWGGGQASWAWALAAHAQDLGHGCAARSHAPSAAPQPHPQPEQHLPGTTWVEGCGCSRGGAAQAAPPAELHARARCHALFTWVYVCMWGGDRCALGVLTEKANRRCSEAVFRWHLCTAPVGRRAYVFFPGRGRARLARGGYLRDGSACCAGVHVHVAGAC
jgi:hypothetical protein